MLRKLLETGRPPPMDLLLPPAVGEDAGVIDIAGGALVAATDPITLTGRSIGGHAVIVNANDVAVMGVQPRWFLAVFLLPIGTTEDDVKEVFDGMRVVLDRLDIDLVGGHTEITPTVTQPVIVGQMLGYRPDGKFLRTGGVRQNDVILQIGPAPIEGAAVLANEAADRLSALSVEILTCARRALDEPGISVVKPALLATELGATALHDPTEGGLSAGLYELAEASNLALCVDMDAVLWFDPGLRICKALGADPWGVLASGTLLAAFPEARADKAIKALTGEGFLTSVIAYPELGDGIRSRDGQLFRRYEQDELSRILSP